MSKKAKKATTYEYRCGDNVVGCTVVITSDTPESTSLLAEQHVSFTHSDKNTTAESINDYINPRFIR